MRSPGSTLPVGLAPETGFLSLPGKGTRPRLAAMTMKNLLYRDAPWRPFRRHRHRMGRSRADYDLEKTELITPRSEALTTFVGEAALNSLRLLYSCSHLGE